MGRRAMRFWLQTEGNYLGRPHSLEQEGRASHRVLFCQWKQDITKQRTQWVARSHSVLQTCVFTPYNVLLIFCSFWVPILIGCSNLEHVWLSYICCTCLDSTSVVSNAMLRTFYINWLNSFTILRGRHYFIITSSLGMEKPMQSDMPMVKQLCSRVEFWDQDIWLHNLCLKPGVPMF